MQNEILKALIKSGILGIVLAWALYENSQLVERVFKVVDNNTRAMIEFQNACSEKLGAAVQ